MLNVQQIQALYPRPGKGAEGLGCCEVPKLNVAGTATEVNEALFLLLKLPWTLLRLLFLSIANLSLRRIFQRKHRKLERILEFIYSFQDSLHLTIMLCAVN